MRREPETRNPSEGVALTMGRALSCTAGVASTVTSPTLHLVADVDLAHVLEASHQPAGALGYDDRHVGAEAPQRRPVEVVEVDV